MSAPKIIIDRDGAEFVVTVEPPVAGVDHTGRYPTHRDAYGFAVGLRMTHGWAVENRAGDVRLAELLSPPRRSTGGAA
jgi:hypothetical protein